MKPILFNTEEVRATIDGHKSMKRLVVKPKYCDSVFEMYHGQLCEASPYIPPRKNGDGTITHTVRRYEPCKQPYHSGDILYVRETWARYHEFFLYRVDCPDTDFMLSKRGVTIKWRSSVQMPKEAARIFLRVTDVQVERLQDIITGDYKTPLNINREGLIFSCCYCKHVNGDCEDFISDNTCCLVDDYIALWNSTLKKADRSLYGWNANPWVRAIEFERISKEEALASA